MAPLDHNLNGDKMENSNLIAITVDGCDYYYEVQGTRDRGDWAITCFSLDRKYVCELQMYSYEQALLIGVGISDESAPYFELNSQTNEQIAYWAISAWSQM